MEFFLQRAMLGFDDSDEESDYDEFNQWSELDEYDKAMITAKMNENSEGWWSTNLNYYKPDENDSKLVEEARRGNIAGVRAIIDKSSKKDKAGVVNAARKWTEVVEKMGGYDKTWDWFGDTALTASARAGHIEVVKYLLYEGADPTLEGCPTDDEYECPMKAVTNRLSKLERELSTIEAGDYHLFMVKVSDNAKEKIESILKTKGNLEVIVDVLNVALKFWKKNPQSSSHYSKQKVKQRLTNKCLSLKNLKQEIESIETSREFDAILCEKLISCYSDLIDTKKKKEEEERASRRRQHGELRGFAYGAMGGHPLQTEGCAGEGCLNLPAVKCVWRSCVRCCSGPCPRHSNK